MGQPLPTPRSTSTLAPDGTIITTTPGGTVTAANLNEPGQWYRYEREELIEFAQARNLSVDGGTMSKETLIVILDAWERGQNHGQSQRTMINQSFSGHDGPVASMHRRSRGGSYHHGDIPLNSMSIAAGHSGSAGSSGLPAAQRQQLLLLQDQLQTLTSAAAAAGVQIAPPANSGAMVNLMGTGTGRRRRSSRKHDQTGQALHLPIKSVSGANAVAPGPANANSNSKSGAEDSVSVSQSHSVNEDTLSNSESGTNPVPGPRDSVSVPPNLSLNQTAGVINNNQDAATVSSSTAPLQITIPPQLLPTIANVSQLLSATLAGERVDGGGGSSMGPAPFGGNSGAANLNSNTVGPGPGLGPMSNHGHSHPVLHHAHTAGNLGAITGTSDHSAMSQSLTHHGHHRNSHSHSRGHRSKSTTFAGLTGPGSGVGSDSESVNVLGSSSASPSMTGQGGSSALVGSGLGSTGPGCASTSLNYHATTSVSAASPHHGVHGRLSRRISGARGSLGADTTVQMLHNLRNLNGHMGVDIGGTLAKLVRLFLGLIIMTSATTARS